MNILGVSCYFHDAAAALLQDGLLVAASEEERFTRVKHDPRFPDLAIDFCLRRGGIRAEDLDYVVFFEKPFLKFDRLLTSALQTFPRSREVFTEAMLTWLGDKLWVKDLLRKKLRIAPEKILFSEHHISHAASSFFCSPFDSAAILTVDGVGEWATATVGRGEGTNIEILEEIRYPHSLGLLYSAFTAFLGFEVNDGEYKVMGMAPFGEPRYVDDVRKVVRVSPDGGFELDLDYFSFHYSTTRTYNRKFEALFGEPRDPSLPFFTRSSGFPSYFGERPADYERLAIRNEHYADIAASAQVVTEEILLSMARHARELTGLDRLCLAGGVALNSAANGRIIREGPFREIFIQPAAGDAGGALGAALYAYHSALGNPRRFVMEHAYWGDDEAESATVDFLRANGIAHRQESDDARLRELVVERLTQGKVVGWVQGRFEWGPRALGNRSILADPRRAEMKDIVNTKIKFREPFRPFAPSVREDRAADYFDMAHAAMDFPSRFMMCVTPVLENRFGDVAAVTHVDGTARVQSVAPSSNSRYHALIDAFGDATGVPVLLNTSFNLRGEPIVNTAAEAFNTFSKSGMDSLVLGNSLIDKT